MQNIVAGMLLLLLGAWLALSPQTVWKVGERWKFSEDAEPSKGYLRTVQLVGGVMLLTGVAVCIWG